jgi:hypothetical protein|tara:strand:+ start:129 stop:278 length:150 start_codon:yes stop_codon:yes gene_type:complete
MSIKFANPRMKVEIEKAIKAVQKKIVTPKLAKKSKITKKSKLNKTGEVI